MIVDTLLAKVIGTQNERDLKRLRPLVVEINANGEPVFIKLQSSDGRRRLYRVDTSDRKCSAQLSRPSEQEVKDIERRSTDTRK